MRIGKESGCSQHLTMTTTCTRGSVEGPVVERHPGRIGKRWIILSERCGRCGSNPQVRRLGASRLTIQKCMGACRVRTSPRTLKSQMNLKERKSQLEVAVRQLIILPKLRFLLLLHSRSRCHHREREELAIQ